MGERKEGGKEGGEREKRKEGRKGGERKKRKEERSINVSRESDGA